METVGMIGTGAMGLALLDRLKLAVAADVICYDAHGPALEDVRKLGFTAAAKAAEIAKRATLIAQQLAAAGVVSADGKRNRR